MTVHERPVSATVEWYTPVSLFDALGGYVFDLDPAAGRDETEADLYNRVPARRKLTANLDGLAYVWRGHVWLNPPYGRAGVTFVDRMIAHGDGLLLLPSRTETAVYQRALTAADAICLLRDRLWFTRNDGATGRSSFGSTLFAFGWWAVAVLIQADLGWVTWRDPADDERRPEPWEQEAHIEYSSEAAEETREYLAKLYAVAP